MAAARPVERGRYLFKLAEAIRRRLDDFAMTDTLNVGKPIRDTKGFDVPCAADLFESYAGLADKIAGKCFGTLPDNFTFQIREPLRRDRGDCAMELPADQCGDQARGRRLGVRQLRRLQAVGAFAAVGPDAGGDRAGDRPATRRAQRDPRHRRRGGQGPRRAPGVDKISFTGRLETGRRIMDAAKIGMKGVMLELGGKTPNVVFPDAPIEHVVNGVLTGIFFNLGQVCVAASRLLVHKKQHDELMDRLIQKAKTLRQGDPPTNATILAVLPHPRICRRSNDTSRRPGARRRRSSSAANGPAIWH